MSETFQISSNSVEQTLDIGKTIGQHLQGGEVIALIGQLAAGKTHLTKGIAMGLEVPTEEVNSPTFTLINEYEGKLPLYHIDAYRLDTPQQLANIGFDELCSPPNIVLVEWADIVWSIVEAFNPIIIKLQHEEENQRNIQFENTPNSLASALK